MDKSILIVGAGQAGVEVACQLRQGGFIGSVTLLGMEEETPYERPPLSKGCLNGTYAEERLVLRERTTYAESNIDLITGDEVLSVDKGVATTAAGRTIPFDELILATGADPITPRWGQEYTAHTLRTLADVRRIRAAIAEVRTTPVRIVIAGGGFLGLEAASSLKAEGAEVTVVEVASALLPGRISLHMAETLQAMHEEAGVELRLATRIVAVEERTTPESRIHLDDGSYLDADVFVVAVGVKPAVELAQSLGIECGRGILVDDLGRTSQPNVWAIGDAASYVDSMGQEVRIESVQHAVSSARIAAAAIVGGAVPASRVSTFWSEQYGKRLQMAGRVKDESNVREEVETLSPESLVVRRYQGDRLVQIETLSAPATFVQGIQTLRENVRGIAIL